jgi:hypothetical protein
LIQNDLAEFSDIISPVKLLAEKLGNPTIIKKGLIDVISNGKQSALVWNQSSMKRCGG